jgi:two-component system, OmpR family, response regulator
VRFLRVALSFMWVRRCNGQAVGPDQRGRGQQGPDDVRRRHATDRCVHREDVRMRVLLVEDELKLAEALERGLSAEGFEVDVATDGLEGLSRATDKAYAAIVLDILLPGLNGYRVAQTLRERQVWTPILMLTAKGGEYDEADALDLGADDFLRKPFSFVVLIARLRALIRRGETPRANLLQHGNLTFDPVSRLCTKDEVTIELSKREAQLLVTLLRHKDQVLSKESLLEQVWGSDGSEDPNVVEVYIGYLRKKLGTDKIITVRGTGYRLADPDA